MRMSNSASAEIRVTNHRCNEFSRVYDNIQSI